ncbi:MAG TPA: hypothetical protein VKM55_30440 [Candidatus Lokiarchaeia archaeon]|nr:hypothetical protein [Candidatus Lokiarchaeia archaeon]
MPLSPHLKFLIPGLVLFLYGIWWIAYFPILPYITNMLSTMNTSGNPVLNSEMQMLNFMSSAGFVDFMLIMGIACVCIGLPLLIIGVHKKKQGK